MYRLVMLIMLASQLIACAQQKPIIRDARAFFFERTPGNVPVDPRTGEAIVRRDTIITVYVETTATDIRWDTARHNGEVWLIDAWLVNASQWEAGTTRANEKIILKPAAGHVLWRLNLKRPDAASAGGLGDIFLEATYEGRRITRKISSMVELNGIPSV